MPIKATAHLYFLCIIIACSSRGSISYLERYTRSTQNQGTVSIAGEIHDSDPANQKDVLAQSLISYAAAHSSPLSVYLEDPLAIAGLEHIRSPRGLLLGLTAHLQALSLPSFITIKNFDTKTSANCALHYFSTPRPIINEQATQINTLTFGHLITELETAHQLYQKHPIIDGLSGPAKTDCQSQLTRIGAHLHALENNLTQWRINPGDSIARTAVQFHQTPISPKKIYDSLYQADVGLTSLAAIVATLGAKHNVALVCGELHAQDVSRILEHEKWHHLDGPYSFTSQWLV